MADQNLKKKLNAFVRDRCNKNGTAQDKLNSAAIMYVPQHYIISLLPKSSFWVYVGCSCSNIWKRSKMPERTVSRYFSSGVNRVFMISRSSSWFFCLQSFTNSKVYGATIRWSTRDVKVVQNQCGTCNPKGLFISLVARLPNQEYRGIAASCAQTNGCETHWLCHDKGNKGLQFCFLCLSFGDFHYLPYFSSC